MTNKLKRQFCILILIIAVAWTQAVPAFAVSAAQEQSTPPQTQTTTNGPGQLQAKSAIVMDADTGKILYEKDANTKREPASTTKIITCMLALEHLELDQVVTISGKTENMGNVLDLKDGEQLTVENLLYGLMVYSANDTAVVLAKEIGGSVNNFAKMMDAKAKEYGAKNTHFLNPNGLNWQGQEAHLTTAYDLAVITREAMKNETFRKLVSTKRYTIPATNKSKARKLVSTNACMVDTKTKIKVNGITRTPKYEGTNGVKTGLTSTAGACFVGSVNKNGTHLISVVLHSGNNDRFADTIQLWDYAIEKFYDTHEMVKEKEELEKVRVKRGAHRSVMAVAETSAYATIPKGTSTKGIKVEFEEKKLQAPVEKGQVVGTVKVYNGDELVSWSKALAAETIEKGGPLSYIGIADWAAILIYIGAGLLLAICVILHALRKKSGKMSKRQRRKARREKRHNRNV